MLFFAFEKIIAETATTFLIEKIIAETAATFYKPVDIKA